jgi:hypothetical protein
MPLSSVVGAQSIVKPGVCTSSTRPASPYDGQVIYETDTDKTLVYNGSAWVYLSTSRANPGGLDLIKTQTIGSAVSSVTVSDAFSSTYDNYKIIISGGTCSSADRLFQIKLGSTTTGYYAGYSGTVFSTSAATLFADNNAANWTRFAIGRTDGLVGDFDLVGPNLAKNTYIHGFQIDTTLVRIGAGFLNNTTQYTDITFTTDSGTVTGGTIYVYGYAK